MVGVPRSQGCRNCRRRKKGCDLQRPVCGQCARANITCGWSERQWTFVSHEATEAGPSTVGVRSRMPDVPRRLSSPSPPSGLQQRSLDRTAFEVGADEEFWTQYLPKDGPHTIYVGGVYTSLWVKTLRDIAASDNAARTALTALATLILGRSHSDTALLQESTRLYGRALLETNRALQDIERAKSDAALACCKILAMYENFRLDSTARISSQGHDWHKHVEGTCRIVELRGPAKHVSYHGHSLFETVRIQAVIAGITQRKPNSITNLAWSTLPGQASSRTLYDKLIDIMTDLPDLFQEQDINFRRLETSETDLDRFAVLTDGQSHIDHSIRIGNALREWEQEALLACLEQRNVDPHDYASPVTLPDVCKDHGYGFYNVSMWYWVACLVCYSAMWITHQKVTLAIEPDDLFTSPARTRLSDIPDWANPNTAATNIVASASHYFEEAAGFWGPQFAQFPIGAALHFFAATGAHNSEEMAQLRQILNEAKHGSITNEFLRSIANVSGAKGDPSRPEVHVRMASSFFRTDTLQDSHAPTLPTLESQDTTP